MYRIVEFEDGTFEPQVRDDILWFERWIPIRIFNPRSGTLEAAKANLKHYVDSVNCIRHKYDIKQIHDVPNEN